jgi:phosphohistidine phosphatase
MLLYFLRHGDAVESSTLHDSERPLSDLGVRQAFQAGKFLLSTKPRIHLILTSPLLRARQTTEGVLQSIHTASMEISEYLTPGSDPRNVFNDLKSRSLSSVLLVGHEPFLSDGIGQLIGSHGQAHVSMKKGSLACVETPVPLQRGSGNLLWLVTAEHMMVA